MMELFNEAADLSGVERGRFLDRACVGDAELRAEVESLLANDADASPIDQPALDTRHKVTEFAGAGAAPAVPLPEQLGGFRILALLGAGGMGIVYQATQLSTGQTVALKLIRPELGSAAARRRFQAETAILGRLRHPGIVAIHDAGTVNTSLGPQPYIAMEYVAGTPLTEFVVTQEPDTRIRVELLIQLCDAVEYAHQRGIIHRDLKPSNVRIESVDGTVQARILDFGVARLIDRDVTTTTITAPGQLVGTLAYMSPEQLDADPHSVDTRADVYSLGAVGYELLCDCLPIDVRGSSVYAAMRAIRETVPRPLATHQPALRGDLDTIILKALAKDPDQRYASATTLGQDLRRYVSNQPILARKPSLPYVARKFAARHRSLVITAVLVVVLLVAGITGTTYGLLQARQSSAQLRTQVRDTTETASYLAQEVVANLDAISGTAEVRQRMLDRLGHQVDRLLVQAPGDPVLIKARATILSQRADLEFSAGHSDAALGLRRAALALFESLAAADAANADRHADVSIALAKIGDVYKGQRDLDAARSWYERALEIDLRLAAAQPDSTHFLDNLAWSFDRLADNAMAQGHLDDAAGFLRERVRTNEQLLTLQPDRLLHRYGLWEAQDLLATLAEKTSDINAWQQETRAALETARQLVAEQSGNRNFLLALAIADSRLGGAPWVDPGEAVAALTEALRLLRRLHAGDPEDTRTRMLLWWSLFRRGELAWQMQDAPTTLRTFEELLELAREAGVDHLTEWPARDTARAAEYMAQARAHLATQPAGTDAP